jgi:DNA-binding NarL/FixJ family response regulator
MNDFERHSPVGVLVVDDFEPFRRFVCETVGCRAEFQVIAEAADGLEAVQRAKELPPDLILLDIGLPKMNGLEAAHQMSRIAPRATIVFVSQEADPDIVKQAMSNGAKGYVSKQNAVTELLPAIEAVLRGDRFVSPAVQ